MVEITCNVVQYSHTHLLQQLINLRLQILPPLSRAASLNIILVPGYSSRKPRVRRQLCVKQGFQCPALSVEGVVVRHPE